MKIARIETFLFDPGTAKNLLFCRVETESGIHGWGEAKAVQRYEIISRLSKLSMPARAAR